MQVHEALLLEGVGDYGYGGWVAACRTTVLEDGEEDVLVGVCGVTFGAEMGGVGEGGELVGEVLWEVVSEVDCQASYHVRLQPLRRYVQNIERVKNWISSFGRYILVHLEEYVLNPFGRSIDLPPRCYWE